MQRGAPKTSQACDTCRKRKSRCDGRRPSCTFCTEAGRACSYRPLELSEFEAAVQLRLTKLEIRFQGLEAQLANQPAQSTSDPASTPLLGHEYRLPSFHHGAGHKMLQYWPRLRVNLNLPDLDVLSYIKEAERDDSLMTAAQTWGSFNDRTAFTSVLTHALETIQSSMARMPLSVFTLLTQSDTFSLASTAEAIYQYRESSEQTTLTEFCSQIPLPSLLLCGIALWYNEPYEIEIQDRHTARFCLHASLSRLWQIYAETDEVLLPLSICYAQILLYMYAQPHAALGVLRTIDTALHRLQKRSSNFSDRMGKVLANLFYILQSDILTEIDGVPSSRLPEMDIPMSEPEAAELGQQNNSSSTSHSYGPGPFQLTIFQPKDALFARITLQLRSSLNNIVQNLFITERAFCRPHEVETVVLKAMSVLDDIYASFPPELRFPRDVKSFNLLPPARTFRIVEVALRYHACIFMLHRPNLYWVLYQDFEEPKSPSSDFFAERNLDPWVLESCRRCIDSAKLIILNIGQPSSDENSIGIEGMRRLPDWTEVQLLVGAFATLLSVQTATSFSPAFRDAAEIDQLLDQVQEIIFRVKSQSLGFYKTYEILVNMRQNIYATSPLS